MSAPVFLIVSTSSIGLWISSSVAMQTVLPWYRGIISSMMETSKVMAARARKTVE